MTGSNQPSSGNCQNDRPPEYFQCCRGLEHYDPPPEYITLSQAALAETVSPPSYFECQVTLRDDLPPDYSSSIESVYPVHPLGPMHNQTERQISNRNVSENRLEEETNITIDVNEDKYINVFCSVFTCLFCFWPMGACAICKVLEVGTAIKDGDMLKAKKASRAAQKLWIGSCLICLLLILPIASVIIILSCQR